MIEHKKLKQFGMIVLGFVIAWSGTPAFVELMKWTESEVVGLGVPAVVTTGIGSLLSIAFFALANWYRTNRLTNGGRMATAGGGDSF